MWGSCVLGDYNYERISRVTTGVASKKPSFLKCHDCRAKVKICRSSPVMATFPLEWKILEWDENPQTNTFICSYCMLYTYVETNHICYRLCPVSPWPGMLLKVSISPKSIEILLLICVYLSYVTRHTAKNWNFQYPFCKQIFLFKWKFLMHTSSFQESINSIKHYNNTKWHMCIVLVSWVVGEIVGFYTYQKGVPPQCFVIH